MKEEVRLQGCGSGQIFTGPGSVDQVLKKRFWILWKNASGILINKLFYVEEKCTAPYLDI